MAAKGVQAGGMDEQMDHESPKAWLKSIAVSTKARCEGPEDGVSLLQLDPALEGRPATS